MYCVSSCLHFHKLLVHLFQLSQPILIEGVGNDFGKNTSVVILCNFEPRLGQGKVGSISASVFSDWYV